MREMREAEDEVDQTTQMRERCKAEETGLPLFWRGRERRWESKRNVCSFSRLRVDAYQIFQNALGKKTDIRGKQGHMGKNPKSLGRQ